MFLIKGTRELRDRGRRIAPLLSAYLPVGSRYTAICGQPRQCPVCHMHDDTSPLLPEGHMDRVTPHSVSHGTHTQRWARVAVLSPQGLLRSSTLVKGMEPDVWMGEFRFPNKECVSLLSVYVRRFFWRGVFHSPGCTEPERFARFLSDPRASEVAARITGCVRVGGVNCVACSFACFRLLPNMILGQWTLRMATIPR